MLVVSEVWSLQKPQEVCFGNLKGKKKREGSEKRRHLSWDLNTGETCGI